MDTMLYEIIEYPVVIETEVRNRNVSVTVTINQNDSTRDKKAIK